MGAFESCLHSCCGDTLSEPKPIKATMSRTSSTYESTFEDGVAARSVRSAEGGLTTGLAQWQRSHMATVQESHVQEQEFLERQFKLTYGHAADYNELPPHQQFQFRMSLQKRSSARRHEKNALQERLP
mmetsp:Transcript_10232/g.27260  ORF Transcript_10232/g.27260 Transcript_10232/m.27260 type:complete len:128 (-) Transcript_10232:58-441(-)